MTFPAVETNVRGVMVKNAYSKGDDYDCLHMQGKTLGKGFRYDLRDDSHSVYVSLIQHQFCSFC